MNRKQIKDPKGQLLKTVFPEIYKDWDNDMNPNKDKNLITIGSNKFNVNWKCHKCGYKWEQKVVNRIKSKCFICSNKDKLLEFTNPEIYKEFDLDNNVGINPKVLLIGSNKKVNWKCQKCNYKWSQNIDTRVKLETKCKQCSNKDKLFVNTHPDLLREWDYKKNKGINPNLLLSGSNQKIWWKCLKCGNSYQSDLYNRTKNGSNCGKCRVRTKTMIPVFEKFPDLEFEWDYNKNSGIEPSKLTTGSNVKVWWNCPNGHSYQSQIYDRTTKKTGCPFCRGLQIDSSNSLKELRPDLVKEWDFEMNKSISPSEVSLHSTKKIHWKCLNGHKWVSSIENRTKKKGTTCPVCSGRTPINKTSFGYLYPDLLKEWDLINNQIDPFNIRPGSHKKVIWKCKEGHNWETPLYSRVDGSFGCPFCSGRYTTLERSIGYLQPTFMDEWDDVKNEKFDPYTIPSGSDLKVWWNCKNDETHFWRTSIINRTKGSGCPYCSGTNLLVKRYVNRHNTKLSDEIQLYYLIFFNKKECFYKIGITKNTIEERYKSLFNETSYKVLKYKIITDKLKYIINIEQTIHKKVSRNLDMNLIRYKPQKYFGGIGECYLLPNELSKYSKILMNGYKELNNFNELKDING